MRAHALNKNEVVYQCGVEHVRDVGDFLFVTTWVYLGKARKEFSSSDCDVPYEFYEFAEYESFRKSNAGGGDTRRIKLIPSAKQVELAMISLDELIHDLEFWNENGLTPEC